MPCILVLFLSWTAPEINEVVACPDPEPCNGGMLGTVIAAFPPDFIFLWTRSITKWPLYGWEP